MNWDLCTAPFKKTTCNFFLVKINWKQISEENRNRFCIINMISKSNPVTHRAHYHTENLDLKIDP